MPKKEVIITPEPERIGDVLIETSVMEQSQRMSILMLELFETLDFSTFTNEIS